MNNTTYNGYKNYQTWAVNLWLNNDQASYLWLQDICNRPDMGNDTDARADLIDSELHEQLYSDLPESGLFTDLLRHSLDQVDWREIVAANTEAGGLS